jgi:hypothetical protein
MGVPVSNQCFNCRRLKTVHPKINQDASKVNLTGSACKTCKIYDFPPGWKWAFGPPVKGDERGSWIVQVEERKIEKTMDIT